LQKLTIKIKLIITSPTLLVFGLYSVVKMFRAEVDVNQITK